MNADDPLASAIAEWQHKHRIADDDPIIAVLELVRLQLHHARMSPDDDPAPPSFEDFRGTIELLDRRSKAFVNQATDLAGELRRFNVGVSRLNRHRVVTTLMLIVLSIIVGALLGRTLW